MNLADLKKPFDPAAISWRVGSTNSDKSKGMALAYIDARDVQDRLDAVCGVEGWQCRYVPMHDKKTVCEIGLRIESQLTGTTEWIWKADGAGDSDVEAEKGALSDAFKRAAVRWGVGRYLYDLDSPWVAIEPMGRSYKIAQGEYAKLRAILAGNAPRPLAAVASAPTPAKQQYEDTDGQLQAYIDQQKGFIKACRTLEDVQGWVESRGPELDRLKRKSLAAWNDLRNFKEHHIKQLTEKAA